jgi:putative Holliday junction resolvase
VGRVAAIDFGLKRIGLAISDLQHVIAQPLTTILAEKHNDLTAGKVLKTLEPHAIETIVIGIPYLMSGKVGLLADEVRAFIETLKKYSKLPIIELDERLTSVQADRILREAKLSRKKRSQKVDTVAAVILLQCYLDSKLISKEEG